MAKAKSQVAKAKAVAKKVKADAAKAIREAKVAKVKGAEAESGSKTTSSKNECDERKPKRARKTKAETEKNNSAEKDNTEQAKEATKEVSSKTFARRYVGAPKIKAIRDIYMEHLASKLVKQSALQDQMVGVHFCFGGKSAGLLSNKHCVFLAKLLWAQDCFFKLASSAIYAKARENDDTCQTYEFYHAVASEQVGEFLNLDEVRFLETNFFQVRNLLFSVYGFMGYLS